MHDAGSVRTDRFHIAPGVRFSVENRGLTMFREDLGVFCCIPYPDAAIWDLLERGYDAERLVELLSYIAAVDIQAAREMLARSLRHWVELQLLVEAPPHG